MSINIDFKKFYDIDYDEICLIRKKDTNLFLTVDGKLSGDPTVVKNVLLNFKSRPIAKFWLLTLGGEYDREQAYSFLTTLGHPFPNQFLDFQINVIMTAATRTYLSLAIANIVFKNTTAMIQAISNSLQGLQSGGKRHKKYKKHNKKTKKRSIYI